MAFSQAAAGISAASSLAGGIFGFGLSNTEARAQTQIAQYNAAIDEQQAGWARAQGAQAGWSKMQQTYATAGKAMAGAAANGVATSSGSALLLDTNILRTGTLQSEEAVAASENQARNLDAEAKGTIYAGNLQAYASRMQGDMSLLQGVGSAFGTATRYFDGLARGGSSSGSFG